MCILTLKDEYIDLLFYAFRKAKENDIYTWLYNEGDWPSGCACGLITEKYPERMILSEKEEKAGGLFGPVTIDIKKGAYYNEHSGNYR